ncbi:Uu.00g039620.m01.CDS01 [Anthostomella pinea]|uniref:Uu.00g039620.m01.CDS01 n=1 Tax=Anthostomella pinea TaxID=933095 RepID=A0AAI8VA11_9PEZI|nr:Uu.00g039620.m01.CDS01 [Anthostomella pinea]
MHASTIYASVLAFAASAMAQTAGYAVMTSPASGEVLPAGETFTIVWEAGSYTGPATINLVGGVTPSTLVPMGAISTVQIESGSFSWAVDCSLGTDATYGLKIVSVASPDTFQWSFPFHIKGPCAGTQTSTSSADVAVYPTSSASATGYATSSGPAIATSEVVSTTTFCPESSSSAAAVTTYSPSTFATMTPSANATYIASSATASAYPTTSVGSNSTATGSTPIPTAGAGKVGAASFALIAGIAALLI